MSSVVLNSDYRDSLQSVYGLSTIILFILGCFLCIFYPLLEADSTEVYDIHEERVRHNIEESYQQLKKIRLKKKKGETSHKQNKDGLNWNLQLFKNNERTMALKKQIQKQKEALKRNMGRYGPGGGLLNTVTTRGCACQ